MTGPQQECGGDRLAPGEIERDPARDLGGADAQRERHGASGHLPSGAPRPAARAAAGASAVTSPRAGATSGGRAALRQLGMRRRRRPERPAPRRSRAWPLALGGAARRRVEVDHHALARDLEDSARTPALAPARARSGRRSASRAPRPAGRGSAGRWRPRRSPPSRSNRIRQRRSAPAVAKLIGPAQSRTIRTKPSCTPVRSSTGRAPPARRRARSTTTMRLLVDRRARPSTPGASRRTISRVVGAAARARPDSRRGGRRPASRSAANGRAKRRVSRSPLCLLVDRDRRAAIRSTSRPKPGWAAARTATGSAGGCRGAREDQRRAQERQGERQQASPAAAAPGGVGPRRRTRRRAAAGPARAGPPRHRGQPPITLAICCPSVSALNGLTT